MSVTITPYSYIVLWMGCVQAIICTLKLMTVMEGMRKFCTDAEEADHRQCANLDCTVFVGLKMNFISCADEEIRKLRETVTEQKVRDISAVCFFN
jgi:hypothetical protein